jgi:hypothetical protein
MKKGFLLLIFFSVLTSGCANQATLPPPVTVIVVTATPNPTTTPFPTMLPEELSTLTVSMHETAYPFPTVPTGFPTPSSPQENMRQNYFFIPEIYIGKYVIRSWQWVDNPSQYLYNVTISAVGIEQVAKSSAKLNPLTGADITGDHIPEAIIEMDTGGQGCCYGVSIYSLNETLETLLDTPTGECRGKLSDLNLDGIYEYVTCDGSYNGTFDNSTGYCGHNYESYPIVVFAYNKVTNKYEIATNRFPQAWQSRIDNYVAEIKKYKELGLGEPALCYVSGLILQYIYAGKEGEAWAALEMYYSPEEAEFYKSKIKKAIHEHALFPPIP